ncbi:PIG-L deacetylase family protein [Micromonospora auratinigra]|uniref:N-acetylglucosaminyl deacetylase, LmbE family n=1 Tax=Micromonospora auratinigra TaxID=261654 RepID=A0A1A8ZUC5_9ACTN|nr:PIG-L deacetylase family protein [Micromonospora auratinigra]SBT47480.1 N-acetylglucosaminyl deacetylase, LmbE family [Micromonospora auratinigra]
MSFPASAPPLPDVRRALAVFAHPDDVDFGCAGSVAGWVDEGTEVAYLIVTRGDSGGFDDTPREEMPARREAEQRAAAAAVGVRRVDFLDGHPDGTLTPTPQLRREITAAIRRFRPDRVLTSSPLRRWEQLTGPGHPDHLAVGEATTCAVYPDSRNRFAFPELLADGLEPWVVREIWYAGGPAPDHVVDVTGQADRKIAAMRAHHSQTAHLDVASWVHDRLGAVARDAGLPAGRLAEAFTVLRTE